MGNVLKKVGNAAIIALTGYEVGQSINDNGQTRIEVVTVKIETQARVSSTSVYDIMWPYFLLLLVILMVLAIRYMVNKCIKRITTEGRVYYQRQGDQQPRAQVQVQIPQNL